MNPATEAPPRALSTNTWLPWTAMLTGNCPPELSTWLRTSWSPRTRNTVIVLLPALTAYSRPACLS